MNSNHTESRIIEAESRAKKAEIRAIKAEQMLKLMYESKSWRWTAPLRWFSLQIRLLSSHGISHRLAMFIKKVGKFIIKKLYSYIIARPGLRYRCVRVLKKAGLYQKYLNYKYTGLLDSSALYPENKSSVPSELCHLSSYARIVYADLNDAIEQSMERR